METYLPIRNLENRGTQVVVLAVEVTGLKNLEVSMNLLIGNLVHVSADLKTELQFCETKGYCWHKSAGSLPRAIELIDDRIGYAKSISAASRRDFSADARGLQFDNDKTYGMPINKADTSIRESAGQWRGMLSPREHEALRLLADCKTNKEIAREMNISRQDRGNVSRTSDDETGVAFYRPLNSLCGAEQHY